jgi:hypothetical protein
MPLQHKDGNASDSSRTSSYRPLDPGEEELLKGVEEVLKKKPKRPESYGTFKKHGGRSKKRYTRRRATRRR